MRTVVKVDARFVLAAAVLGSTAAGLQVRAESKGMLPRAECAPSATIPPRGTPSAAAAPTTPSTPSSSMTVPSTLPADALTDERSGAVSGDDMAFATPNMIGEVLVGSTGGFRQVTIGSSDGSRTQRAFQVPSASRNVKISDNQNVRPQDRIYFNYNYYNNVNDEANLRAGALAGTIDVHRETLGFEKTFLDQSLSFGMLVPLNTLSADSGATGGGLSSTNLGDLTLIGKYILCEGDNGNVLSGGLLLTVPTGPAAFAGISDVSGSLHNTVLAPWLGYVLANGNFFFQGFTSVDIAMNTRNSTILYNDLGFGYVVYRSEDRSRRVTAIAPTFEVHINTPVSQRGALAGVGGTTDWVTLTQGVTMQFNQRSTLAIGLNEPITGIKPYDIEVIAQLNVQF